MILILSIFLIYIIQTAASVPQRLSANTLILNDQYDNDTVNPGIVFYAVNAGFGPSVWEDHSLDSLLVVTIEDCCSQDKLPKDLSMEPFVVITKRSGCSYERKARNVEKINAAALILINREYEEGLLFAPLPELSYYTKPPTEHINIPVMLIKQGDADTVYDKISQGSAYISMYCAKLGNRSLIHAWNFHWICWLTGFTLLFTASLISLFFVSRGGGVNQLIKPCILLTAGCAVANMVDMLTDHWNIRGIISEAGFQVMYWLDLDPLLYMYILTQWLWYRMLDEKDLLKYKAIVINKPTIYAIFVGTLAAGILKIILVAAGVTIMTAWRIYDSILIVTLSALGVCMTISGYRLRKRLNQMMHKRSGTFKLTFMMVVGNIGMQFTSLTLFVWMIVPNLFGVWSWFVYQFYWRFATCFLGFLFLFVYGTKLADRKETSPAPPENMKNLTSDSTPVSTSNYESKSDIQMLKVKQPV